MRTAVFVAALLFTTSALAQEHARDHAQPQTQGSETSWPPAGAADQKAAPSDKGRILYYRNPMGLSDKSPVPKKDTMGMDYIPVYENEIPPTITDHAADTVFDAKAMAAARDLLRYEHGGEPYSLVMVNILEFQARSGKDGYRWDGEAWYGGDLNRAVIKSKEIGRAHV